MANHNSILEVTTKNLQYNYKKLTGLANKSICAATIKSDANLASESVLTLVYVDVEGS